MQRLIVKPLLMAAITGWSTGASRRNQSGSIDFVSVGSEMPQRSSG
jgi:hypothetical protein